MQSFIDNFRQNCSTPLTTNQIKIKFEEYLGNTYLLSSLTYIVKLSSCLWGVPPCILGADTVKDLNDVTLAPVRQPQRGVRFLCSHFNYPSALNVTYRIFNLNSRQGSMV